MCAVGVSASCHLPSLQTCAGHMLLTRQLADLALAYIVHTSGVE